MKVTKILMLNAISSLFRAASVRSYSAVAQNFLRSLPYQRQSQQNTCQSATRSNLNTPELDNGVGHFVKHPSLFQPKRLERLDSSQMRDWNVNRLYSSKDESTVTIRVFTSAEIRKILKLRGKEKRRRLFINREKRLDASYILSMVREAFPLGELPVQLYACEPSGEEREPEVSNYFPIDQTSKLLNSFTYYENRGADLHLYIKLDSSYGDPEPLPWLENLPPLEKTDYYHILSFYKFTKLADPESFAALLTALWRPLGVLGRIYVAREGINAQMAVPRKMIDRFELATESVEKLKGVFFNKDTIRKIDFNDSDTLIFHSLHVRVRDQIVADGFKDSMYDWEIRNGRSLSPREWHELVDNEETIVLDCRNDYETDIGIFDTAEPLGTSYFKESWDQLKKRLENTPADAPIMTYCTGGIRCVKIASFLEQELGFQNVTRLEGGIINYSRYVSSNGLESKFKGSNYVFDNRMAERITDDVLGRCSQCGCESDMHKNCSNQKCHTRFIQCPSCAPKYGNCCCKGCLEQMKYDQAMEQVPEHIPRLSESASDISTQPWLQPHPFQNATLNLIFDKVIEENLNGKYEVEREYSSVAQLAAKLQMKNVLVVGGEINAADHTYGRCGISHRLKDVASSIHYSCDRNIAEPQDLIIIDCGAETDVVELYDKYMLKDCLERRGLMAVILNNLSKERIEILKRKLTNEKNLIRAVELKVGSGIIFVGWKGSR